MPDSRRGGFYRALLGLMPRAFREKHGAELERLVEDLRDERRHDGGRVGAGFWASLLWDLARSAIAEWLTVVRAAITGLARRSSWERIVSDFRLALRQVRLQPVYALTVILLVAVGIAGNASIFRVFNGLFLRPLPFSESEQLVDLDETAPQWNLEFTSVAIADFDRWREQNRTFQGMAAYNDGGGNLAIDGTAERISYIAATHDIDDVLRLSPLLGRFFTEEEDQPGAARVALVSAGFWERQFASDPGVLGRTVRLDGEAAEIIGVLPPEAELLGEADVWMPLRENGISNFYLEAVGRLAPGVTPEEARADLTRIHREMIPERQANEVTSPTVISMRERFLGSYRMGIGFLFAAVAVVLLIACCNIAGLMFARSMARREEMAMRRALGANGWSLVRQLMAESLVLAGLGSVIGLTVGVWGSGALIAAMRDQFPTWVTFDLDGRFVLFALAMTAGSAVVFGLLPALRSTSEGAASFATARSTISRSTRRAMGLLVASEVALATALVTVSALAVMDVRALAGIPAGYRTDGVATYQLQLPSSQYPDAQSRLAFIENYRQALRAIPGVEQAVVANLLPLGGHSGWFLEVEGSAIEAEANAVVLRRWTTPGYLESMGVEIVRGRAFDASDGPTDMQNVAVVNESFVRSHVPEGTDPIGLRVRTGSNGPWQTIIGVARDVRHYGLDQPPRPGTYEPIFQNPPGSLQVALTSAGDPTSLVPTARTVTQSIDSELPLYEVTTLRESIDEALLTRRAASWVTGAFSLAALILVVGGIYGVVSFSLGQRTREIGIRVAMGARSGKVTGELMGRGMAVVGAGLLVGVVGAVVLSRVTSDLLSGADVARPSDLAIYVAVALMLLVVSGAAHYMPVRRAAALDPMEVLRGE